MHHLYCSNYITKNIIFYIIKKTLYVIMSLENRFEVLLPISLFPMFWMFRYPKFWASKLFFNFFIFIEMFTYRKFWASTLFFNFLIFIEMFTYRKFWVSMLFFNFFIISIFIEMFTYQKFWVLTLFLRYLNRYDNLNVYIAQGH